MKNKLMKKYNIIIEKKIEMYHRLSLTFFNQSVDSSYVLVASV